MRQRYRNYQELAEHQVRSKDYRIVLQRRPGSTVAVVAPHGGKIEPGTSQIARAIAGTEWSFYLFEGIKTSDNYAALHLTSTTFDEPTCLDLISDCAVVLTVHGCDDSAGDIHVGGLDSGWATAIARALNNGGFQVVYPSATFPGHEAGNVCNRGKARKGVQIEVTDSARQRLRPEELAGPIRRVLHAGLKVG